MSSHSAAGTVGGALASATARLRTADIPSPRLDAELLLGHLLQLSRTRLAIDANEPIDPKTALELESLVDRRLAGEPVAYLIGHREFMGHDFGSSWDTTSGSVRACSCHDRKRRCWSSWQSK